MHTVFIYIMQNFQKTACELELFLSEDVKNSYSIDPDIKERPFIENHDGR